MKPVLIQHLIKKNKGKYVPRTTSKEELQMMNDRAASFILCFLGALVLISLLIA